MNDSVFNIVTTNKCNAKCPYCISEQTPDVCKNYEKFNYHKLIQAIQYATKAGIQTCKLTGKKGDPLCNFDLLQDLLIMIRKEFPIIEIQTNGIKLSNNICKTLKHCGVTIVAVSCVDYLQDTNKNMYGADYPELRETIELLHKYDLTVRLSCTLIKDCIDCPDDIDYFLEYFKDLGVEQFSFIPVGHFGNNSYAQWCINHEVDKHVWDRIEDKGTLLWKTSYSGSIYDYEGKNVYIANCLSNPVKGIRSLIYYPDGHLRYSWTKSGAIIF